MTSVVFAVFSELAFNDLAHHGSLSCWIRDSVIEHLIFLWPNELHPFLTLKLTWIETEMHLSFKTFFPLNSLHYQKLLSSFYKNCSCSAARLGFGGGGLSAATAMHPLCELGLDKPVGK